MLMGNGSAKRIPETPTFLFESEATENANPLLKQLYSRGSNRDNFQSDTNSCYRHNTRGKYWTTTPSHRGLGEAPFARLGSSKHYTVTKGHFAMNKDGFRHRVREDGAIYEKKHKPRVKKQQYTLEGDIFKYETRSIRRKTGNVTEKRKLLTSIKAMTYEQAEQLAVDRNGNYPRRALAGRRQAHREPHSS